MHSESLHFLLSRTQDRCLKKLHGKKIASVLLFCGSWSIMYSDCRWVADGEPAFPEDPKLYADKDIAPVWKCTGQVCIYCMLRSIQYTCVRMTRRENSRVI